MNFSDPITLRLFTTVACAIVGCGDGRESFTTLDTDGGHRFPGGIQNRDAGTPSAGADPIRYDLVFPEKVASLDIRVSSASWAILQADATEMFGKFGGGGLPLPKEAGGKLVPRQPVWIPATVSFEGRTLVDVGFRLRGNFTLINTWKMGRSKLPFSLNFDHFEKQNPATHNQRLFGIKSLALLNGSGDPTLVRESLAAEAFRAMDLPTPRHAFYRVNLDTGTGAVYAGLYTAVEIPSEAFLGQAFGSDTGNLYKPDGPGAQFEIFDAASFEKKNNEKQADFSDVRGLFAALHASRANSATWRAGLDAVLDVGGFLRWLATNTALENWDTYGVLPHNYYLYHDPKKSLFQWIPWDLNSSFSDGFLFWKTPSFGMREVGRTWPLIRFTMDDPSYKATYLQALARLKEGPVSPAALGNRARAMHDLIAPHVTGPKGERPGYTLLNQAMEFEAGHVALHDRLVKRQSELAGFLSAAP